MVTFSWNNRYKANPTYTAGGSATCSSVEYDFGTNWHSGYDWNTATGSGFNYTYPIVTPRSASITISFSVSGYSSSQQFTCTLKSVGKKTTTVTKTGSTYFTFNITSSDILNDYVYCQHKELHPALHTTTFPTKYDVFTLKAGNTTIGTVTTEELNFTLPTVYDARVCTKHLTNKKVGIAPKVTSPFIKVSPTGMDNTIIVVPESSWYYSWDENVNYYMPEMKIDGDNGDLVLSKWQFATKAIVNAQPQIDDSYATPIMCNKFRDTSVNALSYTCQLYVRNPWKKGDLALGTVILLDNDSGSMMVTSNSGSGYYDSNWYALQMNTSVTLDFTTKDTLSSITLSGNWSIGYVLQNPVVLGCFYTQYTYPVCVVTYKVDWRQKSLTISPSGDGWVNAQGTTINFGTPSATTFTGTVTIQNPAAYLDSFVGTGNLKKDCYLNISATTNRGLSKDLNHSYFEVFKYINLAIDSFTVYRCDSAGIMTVDGDYVGADLEFSGNPMNGLWLYNPIYVDITIEKLLTGEVVHTETQLAINGAQRLSAFPLDAESSYRILIRLYDSFRTRTTAGVISTKVAYFEFSDTGESLAIGKYVESEIGLEIQFPTIVNKLCIYLNGNGVNHMGEAAALIPYRDTYNIGCTNVQQVIDWLNRRLS